MTLQRSAVPGIYAITAPLADRSTLELIEQLVTAGAQWIQIRHKELSDSQLHQLVESAVAMLPATVRLIINDRTDIALACSADGVHLGSEDLPPQLARSVAAERPLIIGVSTHSVEEAIDASRIDATDYIALGPIFRSSTKNVRPPLGVDAIREARRKIDKPLIAIGGIDETNLRDVLTAGADSAAVISALYQSGDIVVSLRRLNEIADAAR